MKRARPFFELRQPGFQTARLSIHLVIVLFLANKMDELLLLNRVNMDLWRAAPLCFPKT